MKAGKFKCFGFRMFAARYLHEMGAFDSEVYGPELGISVMELVKVYDAQGHSGASLSVVYRMFVDVIEAYQEEGRERQDEVAK